MPLPKRQVIPAKTGKPKERSRTDSRFASFETDPKFRLPSKKTIKTKLDARFSRLLTDSDFYNKASVDKYGRKIAKDAGRKDVQKRFYDDAEASDEDDNNKNDETTRRDRAVKKELAKVDRRGPNYDPIRDGGFSSTSSDESSSDEEDEVDVEEQAELPTEDSDVPTGEVTSRLAVVNLDWDNIRAADIMAVAESFVPPDGRILDVTIYPSEFGRERMEREELEGPPREIFASTSKNKDNLTSLESGADGSDSELEDEQIKQDLLKEANGDDFDTKALRAYQLDRLRYYYAIISCSSKNVGKAIYDNMDGREYLSSANFFDLRFVPDDTTFDEQLHDKCEALPDAYKPNEFTTDALTHSKVKLTWDADDATRKEAQKRAFSHADVDENDLQPYLGSDSESEESGEDSKIDKAATLRALLGLGSSNASSKSKPKSSKRDRDFQKPDGEMQITFTAGLSSNAEKGSVFENEPILAETTIEKYVRKEKERKVKRKERAQAKKEGRNPDAEEEMQTAKANGDEDAFNDPFFDSDPEAARASEAKLKKTKTQKQREESEQLAKQSAAERAELELLMVDDKGSKVQHFDMNDIEKAEKAKKKGKKSRKGDKDAVVIEDDFKMDVSDPRFARLYESHEYAIDPNNPRFKGTKGMKALLDEGRKKRKRETDVVAEQLGRGKKNRPDGDEVDDVQKLAARVKAKSRQL